MARQPFLPRHRGKPFSIGTFGPDMPRRVKELIGEVTISWTHVETQLALTMGALLGVENAASVAVFGELRSNRSRTDALAAAAQASLNSEDGELFSSILAIHKRLDGERNDVVHGVWGDASWLQGAALWKSVQANALSHIRDYHSLRLEYINPDFDRSANMEEGLFIYPIADIAELASKIDQLKLLIGHFHAHLRYSPATQGTNALKSAKASPLITNQ